MSNCPELATTKKKGGSDLDHPRAVNSNGKVILTVCLSICMYENLRASKSVHNCLPTLLSLGGGWGTLFLFINLLECPYPLGRSVVSSVYLFVSPCIPYPGLPQTFFPLCLKYDLFQETILNMLCARPLVEDSKSETCEHVRIRGGVLSSETFPSISEELKCSDQNRQYNCYALHQQTRGIEAYVT